MNQGLKVLRTNLARPFRLLFTQMIVQVLCLYYTVLYGTMFLVLFTYPTLWTDVYGQSIGTGGLNFISTAIGYVAGAQGSFYHRLQRPSADDHQSLVH